MNQMVAMVTEKKRSSSMGTLISTVVRMKSSRMKTRLPAMRTVSDTLKQESFFNKERQIIRHETRSYMQICNVAKSRAPAQH